LATIALARVSAGQDIDRPTQNPTPLRQVPRDPLISSAIERDVAPLAAAPPQVIIAPRWRIMVAFAPTVTIFASDSRVGQVITGCRSELPPGSMPLEYAATNSPWAAFDSATASRPLVVFSIAPNGGPGATCGDTLVELPHAVARAIEFRRPGYIPDQNPATAHVRFGETRLQPAFVGRAPVLRISSGNPLRDTTQQLRLYVPLDDLRPDSTGSFPPTELRIGTSGIRQDTIEIPERVLRQIWAQSLPWRIDRLRSRPGITPLTLPPPADPAIQPSTDALRSGNTVDAAVLAQVGMSSRQPETRRYSRALIGSLLLAGADTLGSAVVMRQALEADPCLASSEQANPRVRAAVVRLRPTGTCVVRSSSGVLARGLVFPGMGQASTGRRSRAIAIGTAAIFGMSGLAAMKSRQEYSSYRAATTPNAAADFYDSASNFRMIATSFAMTGVTVWVGSAMEAALKQRRNNASISQVSTYGGAR
jgi:hypothetical protein